LISRNGKARAIAGIYLGDGKSFETEVREAHETSRANREMSINKSDPKSLFIRTGRISMK
jgi:hypothetical protein